MTAYGFLSTYPPTQCGLATFSAALLKHLTAPGTGNQAGVVRVVDRADGVPAELPAEVVAHLVNGSPNGTEVATAALNAFDAAVVQHEYGIYGGRDGEDVLRVLAGLTVPVIVVFHTVLTTPSPHQRQLLERIADRAAAVVVMSRAAARRLTELYLVDAAKISVIPHGARPSRRVPVAGPRPTILTWGLIGPGKGIEWAIDAFAGLGTLPSNPRYLVAGQTHPKVLEREGERYRSSLQARAASLGVADDVHFDAGYRDTESLMALVRQADLVLLPYESTEQATSGVLIEAIAALRPVVATAFPHAEELLAAGAGLLVPHQDTPAMTDALRRVLTEPGLAASMTAGAARIAPSLEWSAVAESYHELAESFIGARSRTSIAA